ncbi:hypothetical protein JCGZ_02532 [Jatropha curcas]|uniref:Uncharacterized protein n=1 Tax=Jatropha curcas TaxID=180498 RepID=A0A067JFT8_JATCU|nr:hypothetical protein JCGZ_02532 [Jatropha curcas]
MVPKVAKGTADHGGFAVLHPKLNLTEEKHFTGQQRIIRARSQCAQWSKTARTRLRLKSRAVEGDGSDLRRWGSIWVREGWKLQQRHEASRCQPRSHLAVARNGKGGRRRSCSWRRRRKREEEKKKKPSRFLDHSGSNRFGLIQRFGLIFARFAGFSLGFRIIRVVFEKSI